MFTVNDFISLMKYFKDQTVADLDPNLIMQAEDSKAKATTLFSENIDLDCFSSDDYKRLKNFLIPWYASLRTFASTMRNVSDVRSLPEEHLNELIRSFGFVDGLEEISRKNKDNFFYDLVNLYKIKGTPEALLRVLGFFGIPDIIVCEYWLQYDSNGTLVFRPETIYTTGALYNSKDLEFSLLTDTDPHWMLSESQINQLFLTNKIAFPSKSPYFGIKPVTQLSGGIINPTIAILSRVIQEKYADYIAGNDPVKDIKLSINIYASILDLYLGVLYSFNLLYNKTIDSTDLSFLIYNDSLALTNTQIFTLYDTITKRSSSMTKAQLEANRILYNSYFTRLRTTSFISSFDTAGNVLKLTNIDLKDIIDTYNSSNNGLAILKSLLKDLSAWIKDNISDSAPNLLTLMFGLPSFEYLTDVINFFKPYRARLIELEHIYTIDNPVLDAELTVDDLARIDITETVVDWDTANSTGCCCPENVNPCIDSTASIYYSRNTFDCDSYFDIGASIDSDGEFGIVIRQQDDIIYNYHHGDATACVHLEVTGDLTGHTFFAMQDGGFVDFDGGGIMDAPQISDVCKIYVTEDTFLTDENGNYLLTEDGDYIIV